jgi:hypothetical protein
MEGKEKLLLRKKPFLFYLSKKKDSMNPEAEVTKPIMVICYEAHKPRLISPDSFFIYGGRIKYKHLQISNDNGVLVYKLLLPDIPLYIFEYIYEAFDLDKDAMMYNDEGGHVTYEQVTSKSIITTNSKYNNNKTDEEILAEYHNVDKMSTRTKRDITKFIEQFSIEVPRFLHRGKLTYNKEKDQYDNIQYLIFNEKIYENKKPYTLYEKKFVDEYPKHRNYRSIFSDFKIDEHMNLDLNSYFMSGHNEEDTRYSLPIKPVLYYYLDAVPDYIFIIMYKEYLVGRNYKQGYKIKIYSNL